MPKYSENLTQTSLHDLKWNQSQFNINENIKDIDMAMKFRTENLVRSGCQYLKYNKNLKTVTNMKDVKNIRFAQ